MTYENGKQLKKRKLHRNYDYDLVVGFKLEFNFVLLCLQKTDNIVLYEAIFAVITF